MYLQKTEMQSCATSGIKIKFILDVPVIVGLILRQRRL